MKRSPKSDTGKNMNPAPKQLIPDVLIICAEGYALLSAALHNLEIAIPGTRVKRRAFHEDASVGTAPPSAAGFLCL